METILVPTDFSEAARNAAVYALQLAGALKARVTLLHVCYVAAFAADTAVIVPSPVEVMDAGRESLLHLKNQLMREGSGVEIQVACVEGFAAEEISRYAREQAVCLTVMGIHEAGYVSERLLGSVATSVMQDPPCPVLVVHQTASFKPFRRIVLASSGRPLGSEALHLLKTWGAAFDAHIDIVHVTDEKESASHRPDSSSRCALGFDYQFQALRHSFHNLEAKQVVEGILAHATAQNADLIVTVPGKHHLLDRLLHEPHTKRLAFQSGIPVLALHATITTTT